MLLVFAPGSNSLNIILLCVTLSCCLLLNAAKVIIQFEVCAELDQLLLHQLHASRGTLTLLLICSVTFVPSGWPVEICSPGRATVGILQEQ